MNKSRELSIIIYSCWKNRDMWTVFSTLFRKYWSDCIYKVILVTDICPEKDKDWVFDEIVEIDDTWARMLKKAIQVADTPYVMLWMDDYLLCDYVQNAEIEIHLGRAKTHHAANYRLIESPVCAGTYENNSDVGYYKVGEAYSLSTQVGIWDAGFLLRVLKDEWSAWDFERIASLELKVGEQPILTALDYTFPYEEGVRKGKWMQQGAKLCKRNGIAIDTGKRPVMTDLEMAKIYFQGAILDVNPTQVVKIQNMLNKLKK